MDDIRTYVYVLRGPRAGDYGFFRGTWSDREAQYVNAGVTKALIRFRDGNMISVETSNLRAATALEILIEERYGKF